MKASNYTEILNKIMTEPDTSSTSVNEITEMLMKDEAEFSDYEKQIESLTNSISELQATNAELIRSNSELRNEIAVQLKDEKGEEEPELTEIEEILKAYEEENN